MPTPPQAHGHGHDDRRRYHRELASSCGGGNEDDDDPASDGGDSSFSPRRRPRASRRASSQITRLPRLRRQGMDARMRLRRRLLRIDVMSNDDEEEEPAVDVDGPNQDAGGAEIRTSQQLEALQLGERDRAAVNSSGSSSGGSSRPQRRGNASVRSEETEDEGLDGGGDSGDAEDEGDEDDEDDSDQADDEVDPAAPGDRPAPTSTKCEPAANVHLLVSRADPRGRPLTVWFDYPPQLATTRPRPPVSRILTVPADACPLLFQTHWERNCVKNAFAVAGLRRTRQGRHRHWHVAWAKHLPREKFCRLTAGQVFNHLPDPWVLGRKDRLLRTLGLARRRCGIASYGFFPEGFALPEQWDAFRRALQRDGGGNGGGPVDPASLWILKPPASACGRGIRVLSPRDLETIPRDRRVVVQRYLANPLLVDGFKFDLRVYVLVTSVDPLRIYCFEEGLARFCTSPYSLRHLKNRFAHLTNYSLNKKNREFVENADATGDATTGSKWSMSALLAHLHARGIVADVGRLRREIHGVICRTIIAAEAHLTPLMHQHLSGTGARCYELFGFDLMLDAQCRPWLIEVNVSPSLMGGSPLDKRVKGLLLSDIFHLVGVPVALETLPPDAIPADLRVTKSTTAATTAATATAPPTNAPYKRRATTRQINKQLHEIVLDPSIGHLEDRHLELLTPSDWELLHHMDDELDRRGHFERIYPCGTRAETLAYTPLFTCPRYNNALCEKWIETCRLRSRPKASESNQKKKKGDNCPVEVTTRRRQSFAGAAWTTGVASTATGSARRPLVRGSSQRT